MSSSAAFKWRKNKSKMTVRSTKCDSEEGSDVTFFVGPDTEKCRIPGHKNVLIAASPVFRAMFQGPLAEGCEVTVKDIEYRAFDNLLKYMYGEDVHFQSIDTVLSTLYAAHKYNCEGLEMHCLDYLLKHMDSSCVLAIHHDISMYCNSFAVHLSEEQECNNSIPSAPTLDVIECCENCDNHCTDIHNSSANRNSQTKCNIFDHYKMLLSECLQYIDHHADDILQHEQLDDMNKEDLLFIAQRETLQVSSELILFNALQQWCKYRCKRNQWELSPEKYRLALGTELLFSVRYLLMTSEEFMNGPVRSKLLTSEESNFLLSLILKHSHVPSAPEYLQKILPRLRTKRRKLSQQSVISSPCKLSISRNLKKSLCSSSDGSSKTSLKQKKHTKKQKENNEQTQIQEIKPNMSDYFFSCIACIFD